MNRDHRLLRTLMACPLLYVVSAFAGETIEVQIIGFHFSPAEITIKQGDTVRWINQEKRQHHNVWFEALGEKEPDYLFPGDSFTRNFKEKGKFPYRCGPHPEMNGVVHVQ